MNINRYNCFEQNLSIISQCTPTGICVDDLVHVSPDGAWNDLYTPPMFDKTGSSYLMILPGKQGTEGYYKVINRGTFRKYL